MGASRVGPQATREYLARMRERYERAGRDAKGGLRDEVCEVTGYHRKAVIRLLRRAAPARTRRRRGRRAEYGPEVVAALRAIWTAAGYPWSVRLKALLPGWVPWARRRLRLTPATERALLRISARQIDRLLRPYKQELRTRMYGRTKPGTLLKPTFRCRRSGGMSPSLASPKSIWSRIPAIVRTGSSCTRST